MPSEPIFDYYAELGLEPTASAQEITAAYRRLAKVRHPDRNPNDSTATALFQRLQEAYDTLSDPHKKIVYDSSRTRGRTVSGGSGSSSDIDLDELFARGNTPGPSNFASFMHWVNFLNAHDIFSGFGNGTRYQARDDRDDFFGRQAAQEREAEQRRAEQRAFRMAQEQAAENEARLRAELQEYMAKMRREAAERKAKEEERRAKENERRRAEQQEAAERKSAAQEKAVRMERAGQEARWTLFKAVTAEDKRKACLHSQYEGWAKQVHQRKAKCEGCGVKRSVTTFDCPYCKLMVCPMCRNKLSKEKRDVEK